MKDARYLLRIAPPAAHNPSHQAEFLAQARALAGPLKGKAINLRVTPVAIEFDLFCSPDADSNLFKEAFQPMGKLITCKRLDLPASAVEPQKTVDEARHLFNEQRFWEVHEVLEGLWMTLTGSEKQLVQGLILAAAALVHAQKNELPVTWTMLQDALRRLDGKPEIYYGWNIAKFRDFFAPVLKVRELNIPTV